MLSLLLCCSVVLSTSCQVCGTITSYQQHHADFFWNAENCLVIHVLQYVSISGSYDFYLSYLLGSVLQTWYVLTLLTPDD